MCRKGQRLVSRRREARGRLSILLRETEEDRASCAERASCVGGDCYAERPGRTERHARRGERHTQRARRAGDCLRDRRVHEAGSRKKRTEKMLTVIHEKRRESVLQERQGRVQRHARRERRASCCRDRSEREASRTEKRRISGTREDALMHVKNEHEERRSTQRCSDEERIVHRERTSL